MPRAKKASKATESYRHIVFENFLQPWFDELYPPNEGQPRNPPSAPAIERIADLLYEGRPRVSADEVAEIIRSRARVTEPWLNPQACIGAGTIIIRPPPSIQQAQEAYRELKLALARMLSEGQSERSSRDHQTLLSAIGQSNFRSRNMRLINQVTDMMNDLADPCFLPLRARSSWPWQVEAVLLYDKYLEIVGQPIAVANRAAAARFILAMLDRLGVAQVTGRAIERVFERGVQALREWGIDTRTTKEGGIVATNSPPAGVNARRIRAHARAMRGVAKWASRKT